MKWGEQHQWDPPNPSAGGEEQREEGSGKCVGLAGSGKKANFLWRMADGITGSEPTGTKHKIRPAY